MLQSLIVGVYAGSSGTGTGGNYSSSGTGTGGQDYGSTGTGTGGNYGSSGTGTGQGGQGGQGYGVAGMIPGTEANREKKADQGQYGVPQLCKLLQANGRSCSHMACCCASAVAAVLFCLCHTACGYAHAARPSLQDRPACPQHIVKILSTE